SWILNGEFPIRKKGARQGIHHSEVICLTVGWLKEGSQSMEYGKHYNGHWNGKMFFKQMHEYIISAFEKAYSPEYQALFLIDNSQGHSAYAKDALLTSRMNLHPGGKQACMRDGWYFKNKEKITQKMVFPEDHSEFPGLPKGMREVLIEHGLWSDKLHMQCNGKYHCDYTFQTLKDNLPKALSSVKLETIWKWEHRTIRWMEAYCSGLGAKDAQLKVKQFSSKRYMLHCKIPEGVAQMFDV
ncbi:hypothetical protein BDQ17DRAFT_1232750, partial [Cyathus striatus]